MAFALPLGLLAQNPNGDPYPGYNRNAVPDWGLMKNVLAGKKDSKGTQRRAPGQAETLPEYWNTADNYYFPPIVDQGGYGSCGVSSHVGHMMTSEMNAYRNTNAKLPENQLTPMFEYPFTYNGPGKDEMAISVGFPSADVYGGQYESSIYGGSEWENDKWGWVQGYNTFYNAMQHRISHAKSFPMSTRTKEGMEAVKWWLYNHNFDPDYQGRGGTCCIGVGIGSSGTAKVPSTAANTANGLAGKTYMQHWNLGGADHAMCIVGWDDRIQFDLDGNGIPGEEKNEVGQNENGAWIIANSWGSWWANGGLVYCPYAIDGPTSYEKKITLKTGTNKGKSVTVYMGDEGWAPYVYYWRKDYSPKRAMKVKMSYTHRSEIYVQVGVAQDTTATKPEATFIFPYIRNTGDGVNDGKDADTPLLGRWADNVMHYEPMEFGVDLTDLSSQFPTDKPLKYFLTVKTKSGSKGVGGIHSASVIDYEFDKDGVETPIFIKGDSVSIIPKGRETTISAVVNGEQVNAPANLRMESGTLVWDEPKGTCFTPTGYEVYVGETLLASTTGTSYRPVETLGQVFTVKAVYEIGGIKHLSGASNSAAEPVPADMMYDHNAITFSNGGFTIPNVAASAHDKYTIEYWIKPSKIVDWNQTIAGFWGQFMIHANANGTISAGWNSSGGDRANTTGRSYTKDVWTHVAIVVNGNTTRVYVNGLQTGAATSDSYSGFPALGNLTFGVDTSKDNMMWGTMDEVRIWDTARSATDIKDSRKNPIADPSMQKNLIAYLKMDTFEKDGVVYIRDWARGNHATFLNSKYEATTLGDNVTISKAAAPTTLKGSIVAPKTIYAGMPAGFSMSGLSDNVAGITWEAQDATPAKVQTSTPSFVFNSVGKKTVKAVLRNASGAVEKTVEKVVSVSESPVPTAEFYLSSDSTSGADRISFIAYNKVEGCKYRWSMPGAERETAETSKASATYTSTGEKSVTLTVIAADGKEYSSTKTFRVVKAAPKAANNVNPSVVVKGETVQLQDKSSYDPSEWYWSFASGNTYLAAIGSEAEITPSVPGVYDLSYTVANEVGSATVQAKRALIVCNNKSYKGLSFSGGNKAVTTKLPSQLGREWTLEFWMKPSMLTSACNAIYGNGTSAFSIVSDEQGTVSLTAGSDVAKCDNYYVNNEWHHYAIKFNAGQVSFYRDGVSVGSARISKTSFSDCSETLGIGSPDNTAAPVYASFDEFRVWKDDLSESNIRKYSVDTIPDTGMAAAENLGLMVYYRFNQNTGNVMDATSNNATGVRHNFGPDGDSWVDSKGVFALDYGQPSNREALAAGDKLDLSSYRVVSVSDEETSKEIAPAEFALDGKTTTFWHSAWSSGEKAYPHQITLCRANLDEIKAMVMQVRVNGNESYTKYGPGAVTVEQSHDGKSWDKVNVDQTIFAMERPGVVFAKPLTRKYIRFTFTRGMQSGPLLAIVEMSLYGDAKATGIQKVDLGFVSASSQLRADGTGAGANVVDGSTVSYWQSASGKVWPHHVVLQNSSAAPVNYFKFAFRSTASQMARAINVYVSEDGANWEEHEMGVRLPAGANSLVALGTPTSAKFVKLEFTGSQTYGGGVIGLGEITAYTADEAAGIASAEAVRTDGKVYDLQGRSVKAARGSLPSGVYIKGGRKVVVPKR